VGGLRLMAQMVTASPRRDDGQIFRFLHFSGIDRQSSA
jgi:hypothetical protein